MNDRNREWYLQFTKASTDCAERKKAMGKELIATMQKELSSLRPMIAKRTNRMLIEAAASSKDIDEIRSLIVQTLVNIGNDENPLYDRYTNTLSREAMRLFYNMPTTVLCLFNMDGSALRDLQCEPKTDNPLTRKEFLLWKLTEKNTETTKENKIDYINGELAAYGFTPLNAEDGTDRLIMNLAEHGARKAICRILHAENETSADRIEDPVQ